MTGDRIFGFRLAYGLNLDFFGHEISKKIKDPERFDIVIFKYPDDESKLFIKRVIGLPGEKVQIKDNTEKRDWHLSKKFPLRSHLSVWIRKTVILRWHISSNEVL